MSRSKALFILCVPVFVKEGSILPLTEAGLHVAKKDEIKWTVYSGRDCEYTLYEDSGDGYGYEEGEFSLKRFVWSQQNHNLTDEDGNEIPAAVFGHDCL